MKRITIILILVFLLGTMPKEIYAEQPTIEELLEEIQALKVRVAELEKKLVEKTPETQLSKKEIEKHVDSHLLHRIEGIELPGGLRMGVGGTFVFQGTPNANNVGTGEDSVFDASYKANIEIEKEFNDWGLAFAELEVGENAAIEDELSVFSNVNRAAADTGSSVELAKLWYEHYFLQKQLTLTGGKLEAADYMDQNEYAYDENTQFLSHMFRNSPVIEFPDGNGPGLDAVLCFEPIHFIELSGGIFEGDADWEDIFNGLFYIAQINLKPDVLFNLDEDAKAGNYRIYAWINDNHHAKLTPEGISATDTKDMNYGFGLSISQALGDTFGVFSRLGWQRPNIALLDGSATLEWAWSAGMEINGKYWKRENDVLAFAVGQTFPSDEWKDSSNNNYGGAEGHIETYYNCRLNKYLAITPDIQFIWNPNGINKSSDGDDDVIFVYGARGQIDF